MVGIVQRHNSKREFAQWTDAQAIPTVTIVHPQPETQAQSLELPGDVGAWYQALIYARSSGYLKVWYKDIGAHVKRYDLLGEIDTPDLDQQFLRAKADLNAAIANETLAEVTAGRWQALLPSAAVSRQSVDEKVADAAALRAKVAAAHADVARLEALERFKKLTAPFDGVVTARKTDIGMLINAGVGPWPALFAVADIHAMRIYVRVPQSLSPQVKPGIKATLTLPQYPDQTFRATVLTTANAIDTTSRTVLVELIADNNDGRLWPGAYAGVTFDLPADAKIVQIPASALLFQSEGLQVAVLGPGDRVQIKSIQVGRNFGTTVQILSGLSIDDKVIDNPADAIFAGEHVLPARATPAITSDVPDELPGNRQPGTPW